MRTIADIKTPLEDLPNLSKFLKISLKVKRDDLFSLNGGESKGRKMHYILNESIRIKADALVTAGSANSNHCRAVALTGAKYGWPVQVIIHDTEDYSKGNLKIIRLTGAQLFFTEKVNVKTAMKEAVDNLKMRGYKPYSIYGGGNTLEGWLAYNEAVDEFMQVSEDWQPDYVIVASGTGGTQAGLHVGFSRYDSNIKVLGISVARKKDRGEKIVNNAVQNLIKHLKIPIPQNEIKFYDNWVHDGYESVYPTLMDTIKTAAQLDGLLTDPTYTGKAMTALFDLCKLGEIEENSNVLFWHTGGLINLISSSEISLFSEL
ncbi:MAG: pyridoxal-phosphate dependent enzyme [Bacteroidetes bacterium]|jgi:1-aminocyclopropane-1-carboxylate deaminase/D-cysteine desulfhydrase-like pyridoxal-dependent ACC family enzyme|nr:pyridoxal-phosphate dependent enzyme [Bacteroidota bacterium]